MREKHTQRKLTVIANIFSALPGLLLVNLAPFVFLLIDGEGKIPGLFHERLLQTLMILYPISLFTCICFSVYCFKRAQYTKAKLIGWVPFVIALMIVWVFISGGVELR